MDMDKDHNGTTTKQEALNDNEPVEVSDGTGKADISDIFIGLALGLLGISLCLIGHLGYGIFVVGIAITYIGKMFVWDRWLSDWIGRFT